MDIKRPHPIRIVIADDHQLFRDGLQRLLELESDLEVIGEACDGAEAVKLTRQLTPDILLLDLAMPRHPGFEALRDLNAGGPNFVRVILLTAAVEKEQIVEALQLGARGVVLKDTALQVLIKSIHTVMSGGYWVGHERVPDLRQLLQTLVQSSGEGTQQKTFGLTARELEVVSAVVENYSNKEIAQHLHIEENTVKNHLRSIFEKLGVSTRLELALFAINNLPFKTSMTLVSFVSNPAGAEIEVDGKFLGSTPAEVRLALGPRTIKVSKRGFKPYQRTVQVLNGSVQRISVDLEPA
jgi:two-component system, NarL family, nitrate/nitrite response regulator NarL